MTHEEHCRNPKCCEFATAHQGHQLAHGALQAIGHTIKHLNPIAIGLKKLPEAARIHAFAIAIAAASSLGAIMLLTVIIGSAHDDSSGAGPDAPTWDAASATVFSLPTETVVRLKAAFQADTQILAEMVAAVQTDLNQLTGAANAEGFAEAALSWQAAGKLFDTEDNRRAWLVQQYHDHIFSPDHIEELLKLRLESVYQQLHNVSLRLVEAEGITATDWPPCEIADLELGNALMLRDVAVQQAMEAGSFAPIEAAGNFVISMLIGSATESAVRSFGNDDKGNKNLAALAGVGAGMASDAITTEIIGSKRALTKQTQDSIGWIIANLTEREASMCWVWEAERLSSSEWLTLCAHLATKYRVPVENVLSIVQ